MLAKPPVLFGKKPVQPVTRKKPMFDDEDELLFGLTESTATRVLEGLKLVRQIKDEHGGKHVDLAVIAYETAALALVEAMDTMKGVRAIQGLNERESAYEKVKILSARNVEKLIQNDAT